MIKSTSLREATRKDLMEKKQRKLFEKTIYKAGGRRNITLFILILNIPTALGPCAKDLHISLQLSFQDNLFSL